MVGPSDEAFPSNTSRNEPATCNFEYSGPMAEAVLLANVAYRASASFDWDPENLRPTKRNAKVEALIKPPFRKGWDLASL